MEKRNFTEGLPCFLGHEHIGSLSSVGSEGALFHCDAVKGALPARAGIKELLFSPYLYGKLMQYGITPDSSDDKIDAVLQKLGNTGLVHALELALKELYGCSLKNRNAADQQIADNYAHYYSWYDTVMKKLDCERIVRTVHPHYLLQSQGDTSMESRYNIPLIRVDTMLGYPENGKMNFAYFEQISGIKINSREAAEAAIHFFFDLTDKNNIIGLKHFQAYYRTLAVTDPSASQVEQAFKSLEDPASVLTVQDYILRRCFEEAEKRSMVFQIHTGMTTLKNSNPALMEDLFLRYPHVKFVLLHGFPFVGEAAYLASVYANVYVDTSWLVLQGEILLHDALKTYLGIVPHERILISTDSTSLEEMYGAVRMTRKVLDQVLNEMTKNGYCTREEGQAYARALLYSNNKKLYKGEME